MRLCPPDPSPADSDDGDVSVPRCTGCGARLPRPPERGTEPSIVKWLAMEVSFILLTVFVLAAGLLLLVWLVIVFVMMHVWLLGVWGRLVRCRQCRKWQFGLRPSM